MEKKLLYGALFLFKFKMPKKKKKNTITFLDSYCFSRDQ